MNGVCRDFLELRGDRRVADGGPVIGGLARVRGRSVMVLSHLQTRSIKRLEAESAWLPSPAGCRKLVRLAQLAEKFRRPVLIFDEQIPADSSIRPAGWVHAQAVAHALAVLSRLRVPIISLVVWCGSEGDLPAFGLTDRLLFLHVPDAAAGPERDGTVDPDARANAGAPEVAPGPSLCELVKLGVVDEVITGPDADSRRGFREAVNRVAKALIAHIEQVEEWPPHELLAGRELRSRKISLAYHLDSAVGWKASSSAEADTAFSPGP